MSALCLVIKKEPEESSPINPEHENETKTENVPIETEFVNIKMEIDIDTPRIEVQLEQKEINQTCEPDIKPVIPTPHVQEHRPDGFKNIWNPFTDRITQTFSKIKEDSNKSNFKKIKIPIREDNSEITTSALKDENTNWKRTADGGIACKICSKTYRTSHNFKRHFATHSVSPVKCEHCDKPFSTNTQLQRHIKTHKTHNCNVCSKVFKSSSNLHQHQRVHLTVKPFKCPLCGKDFAIKSQLMKHQGKRYCKKKGPITCEVCNKEFKSEFLKKSHLQKHVVGKPFGCDSCGEKFRHKTTLIRHIQKHNGISPFSCKDCSKSFTHESLLKLHVRKHTGERPYQCQTCLKTFAHKHNMTRHAIRHEKEKKTTCDICKREFAKESRLKYHMRTHVNEKYFKCNVCPKKFSHRQNVLRHYSRKHPNSTYECSDTDAKVASKVWEDFLNKKIIFMAKDSEGSFKEKCQSDSEMASGSKDKKTLIEIVNVLNEKINQNETAKNISNNNDSDNGFCKNVNTIPFKTEINKINDSNEEVSNERLTNGNEITEGNVKTEVKTEVFSDNEEILPDLYVKKFDNSVEIKTEIEW